MKCFLIFFLFSATLTFAQDSNVCSKDIQIFCSDSKGSANKKTIQCLYQKRNSVTEKCKKQIPTLALKEGACYLETIAYCVTNEVPTNHLQDFRCLLDNKKKALAPCLNLLNKLRDKRDKDVQFIAAGCVEEYKKCGNPTEHSARNCVTELYKSNKVSAQCRERIEQIFKTKK